MSGRFSRIERLVGSEGLARLGKAHVAVVGVGAVGSYAIEGLARAGVGRLTLVDFDIVRVSNINRQLIATDLTLGKLKAQAARDRVAVINPACRVEVMELFVDHLTVGQILERKPDLVLDAIDSLTPKCTLLAKCIDAGVPVLSSMGAAMRSDPTQVRVGPLTDVVNCPLARRVRKRLRRHGTDPAILCVYSTEPSYEVKRKAMGEPEANDVAGRGRPRRAMGSLPTLTGIFGLTLAQAALATLLEGAMAWSPGKGSGDPVTGGGSGS